MYICVYTCATIHVCLHMPISMYTTFALSIIIHAKFKTICMRVMIKTMRDFCCKVFVRYVLIGVDFYYVGSMHSVCSGIWFI